MNRTAKLPFDDALLEGLLRLGLEVKNAIPQVSNTQESYLEPN